MRTLLDAREVERLDPKIARRINLPPDEPLVEGVIVSADQITADAARRSRTVLGILGGAVAAILIGVGIIALVHDPGAMVIPGPFSSSPWGRWRSSPNTVRKATTATTSRGGARRGGPAGDPGQGHDHQRLRDDRQAPAGPGISRTAMTLAPLVTPGPSASPRLALRGRKPRHGHGPPGRRPAPRRYRAPSSHNHAQLSATSRAHIIPTSASNRRLYV
jgi:hypothetical protein